MISLFHENFKFLDQKALFFFFFKKDPQNQKSFLFFSSKKTSNFFSRISNSLPVCQVGEAKLWTFLSLFFFEGSPGILMTNQPLNQGAKGDCNTEKSD